jgi:hypothetical protein
MTPAMASNQNQGFSMGLEYTRWGEALGTIVSATIEGDAVRGQPAGLAATVRVDSPDTDIAIQGIFDE